MDQAARAREISLLEFEIREIREAALIPGEEEELEKNYRKMANSKKIAEALGAAHQLTGNDGGAGDLTGRALRELSCVSGFDETLSGMEKRPRRHRQSSGRFQPGGPPPIWTILPFPRRSFTRRVRGWI